MVSTSIKYSNYSLKADFCYKSSIKEGLVFYCKKCKKRIDSNDFMGYCSLACLGDLSPSLKSMKNKINNINQDIISLDYHGVSLFEVRSRIIEDIIEAYQNGAEEIRIVHGYKHGQAIKTYLWHNSGLQKDFRNTVPHIKLKLIKGSTRGITIIRF